MVFSKRSYPFWIFKENYFSLGLFATRTLKPDEPLGIYRGKIRRSLPQTADEEYVWAVSLFLNLIVKNFIWFFYRF